MSYSQAVKKYEEKSEEEHPPLPCSWCRTITARATLSTYGARCFRCYEAYCLEHVPGPSADKRLDGPKAWAHSLKARHLAGERLGSALITMYQSVLPPVVTE